MLHKGTRYNCRVYFYNRTILLIRPKMAMAMDGNYREARWFTSWAKVRTTEDFSLPPCIQKITGQHVVPIGRSETLGYSWGRVWLEDGQRGCEWADQAGPPSLPSAARPRLMVGWKGQPSRCCGCMLAQVLMRSRPAGDGVIDCAGVAIASETCEELFTPNSPHVAQGLDGVEIFSNGSGSHHELRKLETRLQLILAATAKVGGRLAVPGLV